MPGLARCGNAAVEQAGVPARLGCGLAWRCVLVRALPVRVPARPGGGLAWRYSLKRALPEPVPAGSGDGLV